MSGEVYWKVSTDRTAREVAHTGYGLRVETQERLVRRGVNAVWRLHTSEGVFALKRFGRHAVPDWLEFQQAATARAAARGVPVQPLVAAVDHATTVEYQGSQWQLRPYVAGRGYIDGYAEDLARAADCAALLHTTRCEGLPAGGHNPTQDMEYWLTADETGMEELADAVLASSPGELWEAVRPAYLDAFRRARAELDDPLYRSLPQTLTHGEIAGSNLVFDEAGHISAVLDWDAVDIRPRVYDLARAALFLARKGRGSFMVHPELAAELLVRGTSPRPAEPRELAAVVPILELYCVPTPQYVAQLGCHSPDTLQWYLGWAAEGASMVRTTLAPAVAAAASRIGR
ncbi:phosphotransferase enzyme family protein [Streptomyces sp. NPDC054884]